MASFLTDLVKPYVEKLINGAITESSYICCFTCIAKDFEEEKARLEVERTTFKQRVDVAKRKGEDVQDNALSWEEEAEKLIQEDTKTKQKCFFGFCCHCIWRYRRGKELANKKEQIKKLMETGKELAIGLPARLPDVERYSSQYYIPFKSRESKYKELLDALNNEQNYIVGLQGMGGTGKTTLAKEVGKELKRSNQFTHVIDTTVSFSPDIKKIQDDIAGPLGLKFDDCNESDRPKKLWSRLTNGEKILLILDDVWGYIDFYGIGIPQSDNHKGCSVLVTTRTRLVCNKLGCSRTIQLDLLSEEDAWIMFQSHAGLSKVSTKNLLDKGRKISNECKRLPIAIAAIASSLKGKRHREEWDVALNSLQKNMFMGGVDNDLVDIYKCLKFSYDYLKDKIAEGLFLLCSVFQEDEEISTEVLTRLSIGVGLLGEGYAKYNDARNLVVVAKNKLLDSCLLLKTNKRDVKMHDLIREVAQWIANKEIFVVNFSNKNQMSLVGRNNIKYLLFDGSPNDLCSPMFDGSKLKILILIMVTGCFVDSFFENIAGLRVLNLIVGKRITTLSLPQSIRSLTNIRSLLIQSADLGNISVLGSLQSLETLDLKRCTIEELPQEIAKLKRLRLLNLGYCRIKSNNPFEVIQRCPFLEELYFEYSFNDFCQEITLPALERYHLIDGYGITYDSSPSKCVSLKNDYLSEATFKHVMQTAEHLELKSIKKGWRNIMPEIVPIDEGMNDLIELHLKDDSQLQCLVDTKHIGSQVPNVFSKLVVLKLLRMKNLEELCNGTISFDSLELTIESCGKLRSLFKGNLNPCYLKTVKIFACPRLVYVFHLSPSGSLPVLEELIICRCEQLENIFTCERRVDEEILLPKLKVVKIEFCDKLTYIFDQEVKLDSLIQLELNFVSNFIDISPKSCHSIEGSISKAETQLQLQQVEPIKSNILSCCYGYKLKDTTNTKVPALVSQDQLQTCSISTGTTDTKVLSVIYEDQPQPSSIPMETSSYCLNILERAQCHSRLSQIMCNIKVIKLMNVSKIKSVFMLSIALKMLSLESLTIDWCHELEHIVVDCGDCSGGNELGINVFPKLKELNVYDCKKLKYIFGRINDNDQNNNEIQLHLPMINLGLQNITLKNLPMMIYLFVGPKNAFAVENLKSIVIFQCEKLEIVFSTSVLRCLSQLSRLRIHECNELKHIIEDDIENAAMSSKTCFPVLKSLIVVKCNKLKIVFSTSVLRCLSQLSHLTIRECNELKHIIEDDDDIENQRMSKTCFQMLETLAVVKCNKLKSVFPISMKNELPELKAMLIKDADELEEIFKSVGDDDQKVEIPNLKVVAFLNLPSLCHVQGIQFQAVENRFVQNCKKLSLTSLRSSMDIDQYMRDLRPGIGIDAYYDLLRLFYQLLQIPADLCNENPQKEMNRTPETEHEFSENVSDLEIQSVTTSPTNSKELMSEKSMTHSLEEIDTTIKLFQELLNEQSKSQQHPLGEIDNVVPPSQVNNVIEISVEEGTTSTNGKTITSTHLQLEDRDGKKCKPSFSIVNTKLPATKDVDIGDSQETIAMEDINKLIQEDPLLAFEKLLTGVRSFSIGTLLQELKTLMDSSSDLDHFVSNHESKSKLISLFHGLNQHQRLLPSDVKEFVEKVQNFFNDNIIKLDTAQEVLKKHNQLLDSKTDLMNKLSSAKSTQIHIDSETSTANAKIHELSLQIEDLENQRNGLKSLVNKCDVQKMKLKVECTEWAQQSQELISALASSEVDVREVERARNLAKESFANLKSSFPTF